MERLMPAANRLAALLKEKEMTLGVVESSAGGLVSAALLAVPGASAYFLGGGVIYTREARRALLGLPDKDVRMRGATEAYALLTAQTIRRQLDTTWGLSESGASGPTGNRYGDAAGHTALAVSGPIERTVVLETGDDDREANMWRFAAGALELLEAAIREAG